MPIFDKIWALVTQSNIIPLGGAKMKTKTLLLVIVALVASLLTAAWTVPDGCQLHNHIDNSDYSWYISGYQTWPDQQVCGMVVTVKNIATGNTATVENWSPETVKLTNNGTSISIYQFNDEIWSASVNVSAGYTIVAAWVYTTGVAPRARNQIYHVNIPLVGRDVYPPIIIPPPPPPPGS
jgi:hypothetical protein